MIQKLKSVFLSLLAVGMIAAPVLIPVSAYADVNSGLCAGASLSASDIDKCKISDTSKVTNDKVDSTITAVINLFSLIVGVAAVIMIIIGGLKYITSSGDSGNITGAKNTILYAIIGLVVVALAQFIVKFVIGKAAV